jgi:hypothetical protein
MPEAKVEESAIITKAEADLIKPESSPQAGKLARLAAFTPTNLTEAIALSKLIANSDICPKDFKNKPGNVLIAMQMGAEVGLAPLAALQNVCVINGRPSIWGDSALGIVQVHPEYEWHTEQLEGSGDDRVGVFVIKRRGQLAHESRFSVTDAKRAKLWGKEGPWQTYPDRMLKVRARGFGLRDKFADALRGLQIAEEVMDIPPDTSPAKRKREEATLDMIPSAISDLTQSSQPNRGHEDTGLERTQKDQKKQDDWICSDCGGKNQHTAECKHAVREKQDKKTSKQTIKAAYMVLSVDQKTKKKRKDPKTGEEKGGEPYLVLHVVNPNNESGKLYVWHRSFHEYFIGRQDIALLCEISQQDTDGKVYFQLEHILEVAGVPFVNDKPAEQGKMESETAATREPGSDDDDF